MGAKLSYYHAELEYLMLNRSEDLWALKSYATMAERDVRSYHHYNKTTIAISEVVYPNISERRLVYCTCLQRVEISMFQSYSNDILGQSA